MTTFNIGEDCRAAITGPYGTLDLPEQTAFTVTPNQSMLKTQGLDGVTRARTIISGTTGSIRLTRSNNAMDQLANQMYQDWLAGNIIPQGSITYIISEIDGSTTKWVLGGVTFAIKDIGSWAALKAVEQELMFSAETQNLG